MTDESSDEYQPISTEIPVDEHSPHTLNRGKSSMYADAHDDIVKSDLSKFNGHYLSSSTREPEPEDDDEQDDERFLKGKPILNKSYDILPQVKDDDPSTTDRTVPSIPNIDTVDTTAESSAHNDEFSEKSMADSSVNAEEPLTNQHSFEYPYVIPQPAQNVRPSSPDPFETVTTLTKNMKLSANKTVEEQEPSVRAIPSDKPFDTNTIVVKKKERRKLMTLNTDNNSRASMDDTNVVDLCNTPSPLNTPSTPLATPVTSRSSTVTSSSQQPLMDPTRIIVSSTLSSSLHEDDDYRPKDINTASLTDFMNAEKTILQPATETDMIKSIILSDEKTMEKSSLFRSLIEHTEPTVNAKQLTEHLSSSKQQEKIPKVNQVDENILRPFSECVEQYHRILYRVCECTEELKHELRQVKNERDQMSEDLIAAENAYAEVKKRNEKLKLIINEHKTNIETLKRFSEDSVRYTEEQKKKYAVLKQHAQEKLNDANAEIDRLKRVHASEIEGTQTQLRYAQLRVQSLEQELRSAKQELEQKKKENIELTNICDELLATNKR